MAVYDVGDFWSQYFYVYDINGALADAGAFACTLTMADGTSPTVTITHSATGTYLCTFGPLTALHGGRNAVYAQATGANASAEYDQFDVRTSPPILSLSDARGQLGLSASTAQDEQLRDKVDVATSMIEGEIGPVVARAVSEDVEFWSGSSSFVLRKPPVISLTTITPVLTYGIAYSVADFHVASTGKVQRLDGTWLVPGPYTVTYQAGRAGVVDPLILELARVLLQHLWDTKRAPRRPSQGDDAVNTYGTSGWPLRAQELVQQIGSLDGFA